MSGQFKPDRDIPTECNIAQRHQILALLSERDRLRTAVVGGDPLDPRYTWLPGVIERLEVHAPADEDPGSMYEAAAVLRVMHDELAAALKGSGQVHERG